MLQIIGETYSRSGKRCWNDEEEEWWTWEGNGGTEKDFNFGKWRPPMQRHEIKNYGTDVYSYFWYLFNFTLEILFRDKLSQQDDTLNERNKVIEDQIKTIENLQKRIKEHSTESKKSMEIANASVAEIYDLNEELRKNKRQLEIETKERMELIDKLKVRHLRK